jgi:hypothetical protein
MTPQQFTSALDHLSLKPLPVASEWLGVNEKTIRRWGKGLWPVPRYIDLLLRYALQYGRL